jgi:hypothetical protein
MFDPIPGYRRAVVRTSKRTGSEPKKPKNPGRFVYHTTEGLRFFDYPYPPQYTIAWVGPHSLNPGTYDLRRWYDPSTLEGNPILRLQEGDVVKLQHCALGKTGYALKGSQSAKVETNNMGITCIQTEFVSRASWGDDLTEWEYDVVATAIAEQIQAARDHFGDQTIIDPTNVPEFHDSRAYGFGDPWEMSKQEWANFTGICGHQHVPGQDHWDPGKVDNIRLSALVVEALGQTHPIPQPPPIPTPEPLANYMPKLWRVFPEDRLPNAYAKRLQALLAVAGFVASNTFDDQHSPDGLFGTGTENAVKEFQRSRGLKANGVVEGPTWSALLGGRILPVLQQTWPDDKRPYTAAKWMQALLAIQGFVASNTFDDQHSPDGKFGPGTAEAVRAFQAARGLTVDGAVGRRTWAELLGVTEETFYRLPEQSLAFD